VIYPVYHSYMREHTYMQLVRSLKRSFHREYSEKYQGIDSFELSKSGEQSILFIIRNIRYVWRRFVTIIAIFMAVLIAYGRQSGGVR